MVSEKDFFFLLNESFLHRIKNQRQKKNFFAASISSLSSAPPPHQLNDEDLPDDDQGSSSDGAMCSKSSRSKTGTIYIVFVVSIDGVFCLNPFLKNNI